MKIKLRDIKITETNIHIQDSYRIHTREYMKAILEWATDEMKTTFGFDGFRPIDEMIIEWRAHNFLYDLGLFRSHTKDVDLDTGETPARKLIYSILSLFYPYK